MKSWHSRFMFISALLFISFMCVFFILKIFNENLIYFYSPKDLANNAEIPTKTIKIGGFVRSNTLVKTKNDTIEFIITDFENDIKVTYKGIVPSLFREGQGTIATGTMLDNHNFKASSLLAKHDENYIPAEIVNTLKKQELWQGNQ